VEVGSVAKQEILCSVRSCFYNGSGLCKASQIQVNPNPATLRSATFEIGELGAHARHSMQTLCETFVPRSHGPKEGIERVEE
jgi:hypothetical protein